MRSRGFTLIELMIVVAIVAILGAVALPSYRSSVQKSQRAEARGALLETAQFMQRFYSQNDRYDQDRAGTAIAIPGPLATVPKGSSSTNANYLLSFSGTPTVSGFTVQAVPRSGGTMASDACGTLSLDNVGRRTVSGSMSVADCWK
jgi:type IV pilus assembly protein PilE